MLDSGQLQAALGDAITRCPGVSPHLCRLAKRLSKTGVLSGRMKLGERLPDDILTGLGRIFPNVVLDIRPAGDVYLRLDHMGVAPDDTDEWIDTFCAALGVIRDPLKARQSQMKAEADVILDRCRLSFPELTPVWDALCEQSMELLSAIGARGIEAVQGEFFQLAGAVRFLTAEHDPLGMAELGARYFCDSKAFKSTPSLVRRLEEWLLLLNDEDITDETRRRIWTDCGIVENATAVKVTLFGPLVYIKHGECFDWIARLHALGETATLSWDNIQGIEAVELPPDTPVTTCENETPFSTLVRDRLPGLIIYTAGYPNAAVRRLFHLLPSQVHNIRHWGDSDLDGLCIAALIHRIRSVDLWRCNLAELQRHQKLLLQLSPDRHRKAEEYLTNHPDFAFKDELSFSIAYGWLEQERWSRE